MLTAIYVEALLADPEAADAVWEAWWDGELSVFLLLGGGGGSVRVQSMNWRYNSVLQKP